MGYYKEQVSFHNDSILLYTTHRENQRKQIWQMRLSFPSHLFKGYIKRTTGTANYDEARAIAWAHWNKCFSDLTNGVPIGENKTFKYQFNKFIRKQERNPNVFYSPSTVESFKYFGRYWLECFGHMDVRKITTQTLMDYRVWRIAYWTKSGAGVDRPRQGNEALEPSLNTLRQDRQRLTQLLKYFQQLRLISVVPVYKIPTAEKKAGLRQVGRRDHFTMPEWNALSTRLYHWAFGKKTVGISPHAKYSRELIYYVCFIAAHTGLRPQELLNLKWGDIRFRNPKDRPEFELADISISASSKTGRRTAQSSVGGANYIRRLKACAEAKFGREMKSDDWCFISVQQKRYRSPAKTLKKILEEWGMYKDDNGRVRNLYSFRGLYISQLLANNVPIHTVAKLAGTSVLQIQRHYDRTAAEVPTDALLPRHLRS